MLGFRFNQTLLVVAVAAITLAPGPGRSAVIELALSDVTPPYAALVRAETPELVRHVAALVANTFDVPLPPQVLLGFYPTRTAFAHALVRDGGVAPPVAFDLAGSAIGLAMPRAVFLLTEGEDADRVRLVAHEVMHLVQMELAGPRARPAQWLMEGSAEWAALTLLDRLGVAGVAERRQAARRAAAAWLAANPEFTPTVTDRAADFRRWERATGSLLAYQVAYALAEHLVARSGVPALVGYFRGFRADSDASRNFLRAFGTSPALFAEDARAS